MTKQKGVSSLQFMHLMRIHNVSLKIIRMVGSHWMNFPLANKTISTNKKDRITASAPATHGKCHHGKDH